MKPNTIYSKSGKGVQEASGKTSLLKRADRAVLSAIDGRATLAEVAEKVGKTFDAEFEKLIVQLDKDGFVREVTVGTSTTQSRTTLPTIKPPSKTSTTSGGVDDLDFTSILPTLKRAQGPPPKPAAPDPAAKQRAKEQEVALYKARQEAEARAQAERDRLRGETDARTRADIEAKVRAETEKKLREEASMKMRAEADAKVKAARDAAVMRIAAEAQAKIDAERKAREEIERKAWEEAEKARREAEELRHKLEEEKKAREAEERKRKEAEGEAARRAREDEAVRLSQLEMEEARGRKKGHDETQGRDGFPTVESLDALMADLDSFSQREEEERQSREAEERHRRQEKEEKEMRRLLEAAERRERAAQEKLEAQQRAAEEARRRDEQARWREEERRAQEEAERRLREVEEQRRLEAEERQRRAHEAQAAKQAREAEAAAKADDIKITEADLDMTDVRRDEASVTRETRKAKREREREQRQREREAQERAQAAQRAQARERAKPARSEAPVKYPKARRPAKKWGRSAFLTLFLVLVGGVGALHVVPLPMADYEAAASAAIGRPVKIGTGRLSLLNGLSLNLEDVTVGGNIRIASAHAYPRLASLLEDRTAFRRIDLDGVTVPQQAIGAVVSAKMRSQHLRVSRVVATNLKLQGPVQLPVLEGDVLIGGDGGVRSVTLSGPDGLNAKLTPAAAGEVEFDVTAKSVKVPFVPELSFASFAMRGTANRNGMNIASWGGAVLDGVLAGSASVRWGGNWYVDGAMTMRGVNAAAFAPALVSEGKAEGSGRFSMIGGDPAKLHNAARLEGSFSVRKGVLGTFDLARLLHTGGSQYAGRTQFTEMSGQGVYDRGAVALRNVSVTAGALNAGISADIAPGGALAGRIVADMRTNVQPLRATLIIGGTVKEPQVRN